MPERVGSRARRFRFAPAGAGPRGVARLADREFAGNSRETRRAARARVHRATRTWTLDALRAATEPVKVEAMQAIVEFWMLVLRCCVCVNGVRGALVLVKTLGNWKKRQATAETPRDRLCEI